MLGTKLKGGAILKTGENQQHVIALLGSQRCSGRTDHLRCGICRRQSGDGLPEWTEYQALPGLLRLQEEKQHRLCCG